MHSQDPVIIHQDIKSLNVMVSYPFVDVAKKNNSPPFWPFSEQFYFG